MTQSASSTGKNFAVKIYFLLIAWLIVMTLATASKGQSNTNTDGRTPTSLAPGAPAGSYRLSDLDQINIFSGHLNFNLPIMALQGRGKAGLALTVNPVKAGWRANHFVTYNPPGPGGGEHWVHSYFPEPNWWNQNENKPFRPGGKLVGRHMGISPYSSSCQEPPTPPYNYGVTNTRIVFTAPDGTEYELRSQVNGGQALNHSCFGGEEGHFRGKVFRTEDGTSATFISDTDIYDNPTVFDPIVLPEDLFDPTGYLVLRDGTRFRFVNGKVQWIRDSNGNLLNFSYGASDDPTEITDSLNRKVTFAYGVQEGFPFGLCDKITFRGSGGAERVLRISYSNLSAVLRSGYLIQSNHNLFPELDGVGTFNPSGMVSAVWLPDGRAYKFFYNSYAELARVELPTGGAIEYDYGGGVDGGTSSGVVGEYTYPREPQEYAPRIGIYRRLVERRVYKEDSSLESKTTYGKPSLIAGSGGNPPEASVIVHHYNPATGSIIASEKHCYYGDPIYAAYNSTTVGYPDYREGKEFKTESLSEAGGLLRRVAHTWQDGPSGPRIIESITTLADTNQVSKQTFSYDQYHNPTDLYEYDFGVGAPGPLIRRTHTVYVTLNNGVDYAADTNIHIRNLPLRKQVFDAGGTNRAETFYEYDLYDNSPNHAPLINRPGISGLDNGFTAGYTTRGNVTRTSRALLNNSGGVTGWVNSHAQYDIAGNVVKVIDANGNLTTLDFSDRFGSQGDDAQQNTPPAELNGQTSYAFATKVINALGHTAYTKYDYYLGKPVNIEDANGIVSSIAYNDALDRPTQGIQARYKVTTPPCAPPSVCVPAERRQTIITYDDTNHVITTTSDRDTFNDNILSSKSYYDGLGRTWRGASSEGSTWTINDTQFDALGRVSQVSNPYRAVDPGSASPPPGLWTTTEYDALGRVIKMTTPDGAHVDTAYSGNNTLVIDQAGKKRISRTDALGRLTNVWEVRSPDAASGTVSVSFPNHPEVTAGYQTDYFYDPLDNLRAVSQGAQGRWFSYDSLSRLIRVRTLEQNCNPNLPPHTDPFTGGYCWSTANSYDANDNLTQRIDVRGIVTNYFYDALNRNWGIDYINGSQKSNVARVFDGAVNGKGRLHWDRTQEGGTQEMGTNVTVNAIDSYDALGRPLQKRQHFWHGGNWGPGYYMQHTYDLAGNIKTLTYPSGRTVNYSYDQAGRLSSSSGNLGGSPYTYADTIGYNAAGQMIKERFGTNTSLYHNLHYNNRLQLVDTRLGDSATDEWSWSRGAIAFFYGTTAASGWNQFANDTDNNGNLRRQMNFVPLAGGGDVIPQVGDYTYDELNRVATFRELQRNASLQWTESASQDFSYDRYGNRKVTGASSGVSNYNPSYDLATNRINGLGYDAAGNITSDPLTGGTMTYDAENRLLTATSGGGGSYTYDADGRRVKRITGGQETWHIYGCGGELLAEYAAGGAPSAPQKEYGYRSGQLLVIAEPGSGGNLAWGKATSQSSTGWGGNSSRGVDGNTNGSWSGNSVTHTQLEHQPWWQVDLGNVQQIGTVKLWNRTDCCGERLSNFHVLVSDNPFSSTDLATTINQAGVSDYHTAGQAGALTEIVIGRSGRYVRVQLAGDNYLSLAEVEVMAATVSGEGVKWLITDHLGSTRMVIDQTGSLAGVKRHDFAPFGEELYAGIRRNGMGQGQYGYEPPQSNVRQRYTGYERDDETGLDFAQARYHSSIQGRFTSVDAGPFVVADPQSWNRYSYVQNNPLKFIDPTGNTLILLGDDAEYIKAELERFTGYKLNRDTKTGVVTIDESSKRKAKGTSKALADHLKVVADPNTADVKINIVNSESDGSLVYYDSFDRRKVDVADYKVFKRDAPELAAALLGHTLAEFDKANIQGPPSHENWLYDVSHAAGLELESKVLSDLTGKKEALRRSYEVSVTRDSRRERFVYTSVSYDIIIKTLNTNDPYKTKVERVIKR